MPRISTLIALTAILLSSCSTLHSQSKDSIPDIDQWQILKDETAKDPFAHKNQFTINFKQYTEGTDWAYPLPGGKVISPYGGSRHHGGTDIKTFPNDTIRAAFPGHVTLSGPHYAYGNAVIIRHANGLETLYSHQSKNLCKKGDWVWAGQPIGLTGRTGRATTEHLHFETRVNGKSFDSSRLFDHANHRLWPYLFVFTKQAGGVKITFEK
ncbi:MAG: M23 family metallopeptidase [Bacteroidaceae bacterium]|nr:M23 family metallopeptidase [Bacteroidaceae bacterium]